MSLRCFWVFRPRVTPGAGWVAAAARPVRPVRRAGLGLPAAMAARPRVAPVLALVCVAVGLPALVVPPVFQPAALTVPVAPPAPPLLPLPFDLGGGPFVFSDGGGGGILPPPGPELPPGGPGDPPGPPTDVPEPSGLALLPVALGGLAALLWRKRRA